LLLSVADFNSSEGDCQAMCWNVLFKLEK
jgi:hypothetical protein